MEAMMADNQKDQPSRGGNEQRDSEFAKAPADGNVFPPGAPQTSHGSATGPVRGGTPATVSQDQNKQQAMGGTAAGGNPGTSAPPDNASSSDAGQKP
jgi:hypothetical protein